MFNADAAARRWRQTLFALQACNGERGENYGDYGYDRRWYARITLYEDSDFRGSRRTFNRDVPDLRHTGMADEASSAYVQGGAWQLCTRPHYRGRCVTVDHNVYNFEYLGINDRTESVRRIR